MRNRLHNLSPSLVIGLMLAFAHAGATLAVKAQTASELPVEYAPPVYPPIAKAAHVSGDVVLRYGVAADGSVTGVTAVSGPEMLRGSAIASVKAWKFVAGAEQQAAATVRFVFATESEYVEERDIPVETKATTEGILVTVTAQAIDGKMRRECPPADHPAPQKADADDWVELERGGCFGSCPVYVVRVNRSGFVAWKGVSFVSKKGDASARIPHQAAAALIESFRNSFWGVCKEYTKNVTDMPTSIVRAHIGGMDWTVIDYAYAAPEIVQGLENQVDKVSGTSRWVRR